MIGGHGERTLRHKQTSLRGRDELVVRVQAALALATKNQAEHVINVVIGGLETTLLSNLGTKRFHVEARQLWQVLSPS